MEYAFRVDIAAFATKIWGVYNAKIVVTTFSMDPVYTAGMECTQPTALVNRVDKAAVYVPTILIALRARTKNIYQVGHASVAGQAAVTVSITLAVLLAKARTIWSMGLANRVPRIVTAALLTKNALRVAKVTSTLMEGLVCPVQANAPLA